MEQDIITPPSTPKLANNQAFSPFGCFLAAAGSTLSTLCLLGSAAAASVWAVAKLIGLPDMALYVFLALSALPVLWATIWTAGRSWHVERRLAAGLDIDVPIFKLWHYLKSAK